MRSDRSDARSRWCILRTTGPRTIPLMRSLAEAGIDAWTPVEVVSRRRPRSTALVDREQPISPTFVFVRASAIHDLLAIRRLPVSPHPAFSIFTHGGRVPLVSDHEISGMREIEDKAKRKAKAATRRAYVLGQRVHIDSGSFAGMTGVIEEDHGRFALVTFGGNMRVKIDSWLLPNDPVLDVAA